MAFCFVDYEGNFDNVRTFLKEKVTSVGEVSKTSNNKMVVKISNPDDIEELLFFSDFVMEDAISTIFKVILIIFTI